MLLIGERLQGAVGTWLARVSGLSVDWTGEERRAPALPYIGLSMGVTVSTLTQTAEATPLVSALTMEFAPDGPGEYGLLIGATPLTVIVQPEDDAPAAQARVPEAWAAGLWGLDGWGLSDDGGGLWTLTPPEALGALPQVQAGLGWDLVSQVISSDLYDLTHTVSAVGVRCVFWAPVRSRGAALRAAQAVCTAVRSDLPTEDRGAELGLVWGNRPTVAEPQLTWDAQTDAGGLVDAATVDLVVYAHTLRRVMSAGGLSGTRLTVTVRP